ncbi:TPA: hypothetical protein DCX16_00555 [bacterium]|nr:hypothetical protein [bacterium]
MKIYGLDRLAKKIENLKSKGKKIVLCHGCFDLMHPGHIKHFQSAKKMGDILVVTVTPDIYVGKGESRPVFNETLRTESIAALECVNFVAINKWPTATETIKLLKPDIYVKGSEYEKGDETGRLQQEQKALFEIGGKMCYTYDIVFSSTELLNKYFLRNDEQ